MHRPPPIRQSSYACIVSLVLASAIMSAATAASQTTPFAPVCAEREVRVITLIEDHGEAQDIAAEKLAVAGQAFLQARTACYEGRVSDALALYDGILALGPVLARRAQ